MKAFHGLSPLPTGIETPRHDTVTGGRLRAASVTILLHSLIIVGLLLTDKLPFLARQTPARQAIVLRLRPPLVVLARELPLRIGPTLSPLPRLSLDVIVPWAITIKPEETTTASPCTQPAWLEKATVQQGCRLPPIFFPPIIAEPDKKPSAKDIEADHAARLKSLAARFGPKEAAQGIPGDLDRAPLIPTDAGQSLHKWTDEYVKERPPLIERIEDEISP